MRAASKSLFFSLLGRHPNLIPLKCDGVTKELSFFGSRVGFLTFGVAKEVWHAKLLKEDARMEGVGLGVVSAGICHAISMAADLFFHPGDTLILPDLYWDNYEQIFGIRLEGEFVRFPFYAPGSEGGGFNVAGLKAALDAQPGRAHVLLNFPSNPSGYSPTPAELEAIAAVLTEAAAARSVVVYCDDAYHGLVFEESAASTETILVDKSMSLIRSGVGSPVGLSQYLIEEELLDPRHDAEFERLRDVLARRYRILKEALAKPSEHWTIYPFNAGCFCLLELRTGLDADQVRQRLIAEESVGVVNQGSTQLRLAFCSLKEEAIEPLVAALERVCARM